MDGRYNIEDFNRTGKDIKTIPVGLYMTVIHVGPLRKINQVYEALMTRLFLHEENQISGPGIERLLKDEKMAHSEEE